MNAARRLAVVGYCRNMAVQNDGLCGRGPILYVDKKVFFWGNKNTTILIFMGLNTEKY